MRFASRRPGPPWQITFLLIVLFLCFSVPCRSAEDRSALPQQDEVTHREMAQLADRNPDVRREAIEALGHSKDERVIKLLQAFTERSLYDWKGKIVFFEDFKTIGGKRFAPIADALTRKPLLDSAGKPLMVDSKQVRAIAPTPMERRLIANVLRFLQDFGSTDPEKRLAAARRFGDSRDTNFLPALEKVAEDDPDIRVRRVARDSVFLLRITADVPGQTNEQRLEAVQALGRVHSVRGRQVMQELLEQGGVPEEDRLTYERAIRRIDRYQSWVGVGRDLTNGLSLGSVLVLMALGLSIIYGQMGVINMAHGELMMIGAYATYEMQRWFGHTPDHPHNLYYIAAFPVSFAAAAIVGWIIEWSVVRHLYGRPLETLLATWGVSLILIQAVRVRYGDNIGINSPTWFVGSFELIPDFTISYNRCFILALCALCVLFVHALMNYTRIGLKIRATVQDRETAESLGVCTRRIDGFTFALGAGLAGVAGYALTLIAGVAPDMGQNYIVDSFLVVVTGGVGKLAGAVWAGLAIGVLNKLLEPGTFGAALMVGGLIAAAWCAVALAAAGLKSTPSAVAIPAANTPLARIRSNPMSAKWAVLGSLGITAAVIGMLRRVVLPDLLMSDIQAIWAKVLILLVVVIFIQWRPAGLFPPKGRLADV